jgi:hypothetical protein
LAVGSVVYPKKAICFYPSKQGERVTPPTPR